MKTPEPPNGSPSASNTAHSKAVTITARERRVIHLLLETREWVSRETIDRVAGASNGPQIVMDIRKKITGHDGLQMVRRSAVDRDGRQCWPGYYRLTPIGAQRARRNLGITYGE
jgi:hypothetical protein